MVGGFGRRQGRVGALRARERAAILAAVQSLRLLERRWGLWGDKGGTPLTRWLERRGGRAAETRPGRPPE